MSGLRILMAEDDAMVAEILARGLVKLHGMDVVVVHDGREAIERLQSDSFDVVLTDFKMPGVDGLGVAAHCRGLTPAPGLVVMTGNASDEVERAIEQVGAVLLRKPFDLDELYGGILHAHARR